MTETLAERKWTDAYGWTAQSRLIRRNGKCFLLHDHMSGDRIEGSSFREHLYKVPDNKVAEVLSYFEQADEQLDPAHPELGSNWDNFEGAVLCELYAIGRVGIAHAKWASNL